MTKKPTAAALLKQQYEKGEPVTLPESGVEVQLRPVSPRSLVRRGLIPTSLFGQAIDGFRELIAIESGEVNIEVEQMAERAIDYEKWVHTVVCEALLSPKIVDADPDVEKDEILYDMLPEFDRSTIAGLVTSPVVEWQPFLQEQERRLAALQKQPIPESEAE